MNIINGAHGGLSDRVGDNIGELVQQNITIDIPTAPIFGLARINESGYKLLSTLFYLINKDDYWLSRNFRFLHAFFAGTQWVQLPGGLIKGTNVYNVLIPGRLNILWASVGSIVTTLGKLRKNKYMALKYKNIKSINEDILWPDAWKIQIKIKDLTPNNFNTYINYFVNGFLSAVTVLQSQQNKDGSYATKSNMQLFKSNDPGLNDAEIQHKIDKHFNNAISLLIPPTMNYARVRAGLENSAKVDIINEHIELKTKDFKKNGVKILSEADQNYLTEIQNSIFKQLTEYKITDDAFKKQVESIILEAKLQHWSKLDVRLRLLLAWQRSDTWIQSSDVGAVRSLQKFSDANNDVQKKVNELKENGQQ